MRLLQSRRSPNISCNMTFHSRDIHRFRAWSSAVGPLCQKSTIWRKTTINYRHSHYHRQEMGDTFYSSTSRHTDIPRWRPQNGSQSLSCTVYLDKCNLGTDKNGISYHRIWYRKNKTEREPFILLPMFT